jgi:Winged helix DNA-binding domain
VLPSRGPNDRHSVRVPALAQSRSDQGKTPLLTQRLTAQWLAGPPARDPVAVVEHLLAVQGQDARGARLAIRARSTGLLAADVDRALTEHRSLLITWLNRGTLHLVSSEDYPFLQALTTPPLRTGNARRLAQEGVTPDAAERALGVIERSLVEEGPRTREQLGERLAAAGVRTDGQALIHLLMLACLRGLAVRGPMVGNQHAYVYVPDWLGESGPVDRDRALGELARRYLAGHGPADERDLAKWAGLPLRDIRAGLKEIAPAFEERQDGLIDLAGRPPAAALPPPRLLGAFDPVLLGWRSRAALLGSHERLVTGNGLFRPFALVRGRAAATWSVSRGEVVLEPFRGSARTDDAALEADARDVLRYLGVPLET